MVMKVRLYISSDSGSSWFMMYEFIEPQLTFSKSSGIMKMPIPATGDAPILMNLEGMSEDISLKYKLVDRDDNCGITELVNQGDKHDFDDGSYLEMEADGHIYYYYDNDADGSIDTDLDINTIFGQIVYLQSWACTGEVGNSYRLEILDPSSYDSGTGQYAIIRTFEGIPADIRLDWRSGEMKADGDLKFLIGMVVA